MSSNELILSVEKLSVGYDEVLVSNINLDLKFGEIIAIAGPSGIGKTTILRTIAGLVKPLGGTIDCNAPRRGGIGYIPQKLGLIRHTSVYHNVDLGARSGTPFWDEPLTWFKRRDTRVTDAVNRMGLIDKIDEPVRRLSGGQQRRVATARTLAQKPKLILADEFLSELDDENISIVLQAFESICLKVNLKCLLFNITSREHLKSPTGYFKSKMENYWNTKSTIAKHIQSPLTKMRWHNECGIEEDFIHCAYSCSSLLHHAR